MSAEVSAVGVAAETGHPRTLLLIWQNPDTRVFRRVGELVELADGMFTFRYLDGARDDGAFRPLAQFPDLERLYGPGRLPSFFRNRVMSRHRDSYREYLRWIGLDEALDTPVEVLLRTGGSRATDTFHVVDDLRQIPGGPLVSRFFASGIRYLPGAEEALAGVALGQRLELRPDPANAYNDRAMLVAVVDGRPVGYVPEWLLEDLHELRGRARSLSVIAELVNLDAPSHLKLLCRVEAVLAGPAGD
ncbi:HIRAN domain-containing protein [Nakamurella sp. A5-74]|uniref:HIRAN domain-containing protein n=1 Tax=Nakamurella sp. A5-74 TaxID=3158264 RepID=A0AAU8DNV2_9ACTN